MSDEEPQEPQHEPPQDEELRRRLDEISGWDQTMAGVRAFAGATVVYHEVLSQAGLPVKHVLELTCTWVSATIQQTGDEE